MKTIWQARWIKEWKTAKVVKPVWKKIWSPVEIREWVPIPKPPPDWKDSTPLLPVHEEEIPPWHPMPTLPPSDEPEVACGENQDCTTGYEYSKPENEIPAESTSAVPATVDSSPDSNQLPQYPPHVDEINSQAPVPSEFLTPPKLLDNFAEKEAVKNQSQPEYRTISKEEYERPYQKEVSPYAVKLAQAVIQQKLNKLKNATEKSTTGLTEVIYKNETSTTLSPPTTTLNSSIQKTASVKFSSTTTESSPKIFIVTPVAIKS